MSRKILYCATVDYHFRAFHLPYMRWFQSQGWEVHVAAKGDIYLPYCDMKYNLPIERSPMESVNVAVYKELKKVIEENEYDILHVHTPMAGVLARLAAREARKRGTKVIYTAHGFHFYKGAPLINWMIYYPIEKWLSRYTDTLITINTEDYNLAVRRNFQADNIHHIHGVGVDPVKFKPVSQGDVVELRDKHGYSKEDFILCNAAELNKNKNQGLLIKAVSKISRHIPNVRLLLVGDGDLVNHYKSMVNEAQLEEIIDFLGYRTDVDELMKMCDVVVSGSLREGLPVNIIEAMTCGKPVVATDNRGHRELIKDGYNGFLVNFTDEESFARKIIELYSSEQLRKCFSENTITESNRYILPNVMMEMEKVYNHAIGNKGDADGISDKSIACSS